VSIPFNGSPRVGQPIDLAPDIAAAILRTMELGWDLAKQRSEVNARAQEVIITECLRDGMREALRLNKLPWRRSMIVLPGTESRSTSALLPDGRTDISIMYVEIFLSHGQHDPHAIIECKRIAADDSDLVREYVKAVLLGQVQRKSFQRVYGGLRVKWQPNGRGSQNQRPPHEVLAHSGAPQFQ
jgi:hypothetical protein